jgi:non-ribosomal peptide synthetase component F
MNVHTLVAAAATAHPSRIAVVSSERSLTYGELDARANGLAARLIASGVRPGDPVGVFLHRSAEFVLAALAVLKAGGHYVPLDPEYPAARLEHMLGAVSSPVVLTLGSSAPRVSGPVVLLDELPEAGEPVDVAVHPDDLAYVMFTSGSTGKPKGVAVTHRGIVRLVREPGACRWTTKPCCTCPRRPSTRPRSTSGVRWPTAAGSWWRPPARRRWPRSASWCGPTA